MHVADDPEIREILNGIDSHDMVVADGRRGPSLATRTQIERSFHREQLRILPVVDFNPSTELWLVQNRAPGNLKHPIEVFGEVVMTLFGSDQATA